MKLLPRINSSLMNQVSHGTLNRVFDHIEAAARRQDAMPWGYSQGKTTATLDIETRKGI